ncbi:MAG: S49 family peptidase, partial [Phycisphaerae bacterium]|nr:S49 family peptidase [Phycisphaerae bacterium]
MNTFIRGKRQWVLTGTVVFSLLSVASWAAEQPASGPATQPATQPAEKPATQPADDHEAQEQAEKVPAQRIGHISLRGAISESPPDFSFFGGQTKVMTLTDWLQRLARARNDKNLTAVALELDWPRMSWAQAQEFADAVRRLDKVKPVYTHITSVGPVEYIIASAGRYVAMDPSANLYITGLGAELMFFRGTLDWIGIKPQTIQIGRFKGAGENLTRTGPSEAFEANLNWLLDDLYEQLCGQIARQRNVTVPHVKFVIDQGPLTAAQAKDFKLVDKLVEKADWRRYVSKSQIAEGRDCSWLADYGAKGRKKPNFANPFAVLGTMLGSGRKKAIKDSTVAIIHAEGVIVPGRSGEGIFGQRYVGAQTLLRCFKEASDNDKVKAVVFRINSPGGSALASELIYQAA